MKKILSIMIGLCVAVLSVVAQTVPATVHGFNAGSATENHISAVVGQPFDAVFAVGGYEVAEGVTQAQLKQEHYTATVNYGEGYNDHGFSYPTTTSVGTYNNSRYEVHSTQEGYDLLTTLLLKVLKVVNCGEIVYDGDNNPYPTVAVAGYCWTQKNLRTRHYADDNAEVSGSMLYHSDLYPDEVHHDTTYGRLYTWASATRAGADGTVTPDEHGYVQGVCPYGWHIPTAVEKAALEALPVEELRTAELWVTPNANTNSTGFTALPAGKFNAATQQFIGLGSQTDWWTVATTTTIPASIQLQYYCNTPLNGQPSANDGLSVRCVKNE